MKIHTPLVLLLLLAGASACGGEGSSSGGASAASGDTALIVPVDSIRQKPQLANRDSVQATLAALYPAGLRDRGIGGEVILRILVSQEGLPLAVEIDSGSGQPALDQASLQVANAMRFEPGRTSQGPAKVWVTFPIRWTAPASGQADTAAR